ncbi:MAG: hypothetical protein JSR48_08760 [Verrucomicrobia bacterium]|nr:hypothetical protein [Verrucomicrobiota bacterium]
MGIHVGDVFREGGDVVGEGVNLAARLEGQALPGTVAVSQTVHDAVRGKVAMHVESLGPRALKNLVEPVPVWLLAPVSARLPSTRKAWRKQTGWLLLAAAAAAAVLWLSGPWARKPAVSVPPLKDERSVAVLPFENLSDDRANAYFADGVHEDLLASLANFSALRVISRTSVMQYRGTKKTVRQIAAELGVAYILEGSVRRAGSKVRVSGQLIKAAVDEQVWARTYDRELSDIFAVQSDLAREIAGALRTALSPREESLLDARPTANLEAYDLYLRARSIRTGASLKDEMAKAVPLLEQAVRLDPSFAAAWAELANWQFSAYAMLEPTAARFRAGDEALARARELAPNSLAVLAETQRRAFFRGDRASSPPIVRRMIELYPGRAESHLAAALLAQDEHNWIEALAEARLAQQLDPRGVDTLAGVLGLYLALRRYDEANPAALSLVASAPPSPIREYRSACVPYWTNGSATAVAKVLERYPLIDPLENRDVTVIHAQWLFSSGQAHELVKLWERAGPRWRFSFTGARFERIAVAVALLVDHQEERARTLLSHEREAVQQSLAHEAGTRSQYANLAITEALLGHADAARAAAALARTRPDFNYADNSLLTAGEAWLGNKDEALRELAVAMQKAPVNTIGSNVHELRHNLIFHPLQGDPRFEALLNDPANNAPLPR